MIRAQENSFVLMKSHTQGLCLYEVLYATVKSQYCFPLHVVMTVPVTIEFRMGFFHQK